MSVVSPCDTPVHGGSSDSPNSKKTWQKQYLLEGLALQLVTFGQELEHHVIWMLCLCLCLVIAEATVVTAVVVAAKEHFVALDDRRARWCARGSGIIISSPSHLSHGRTRGAFRHLSSTLHHLPSPWRRGLGGRGRWEN